MLLPAIRSAYLVGTGEYGTALPVVLGGLTYWSGVWATAVLLMALAVTPAATILRWPALIDVRRMVGVTALVYTIAHMVIYFALRNWDFALIAAYARPGNAFHHRPDRPGRDLRGRRDSVHGSEKLAAAAHHELCDQWTCNPPRR